MENRTSDRKVSPEEAAILNDPKWLDEADRDVEDLMGDIIRSCPDWAAELGYAEEGSPL